MYVYFVGTDAVIVKNGRRICGTGASLANSFIAQDKVSNELAFTASETFLLVFYFTFEKKTSSFHGARNCIYIF